MKSFIYTLITLFVFNFNHINAQQWTLAKNISYGGQCFGTSIGTDKLNNIYVVASNVLWKFNSSGNILWQDTLATIGDKLVTDSMGYSYVKEGNAIILYNNTGQIIWSSPASPTAAAYHNIALNPLGGVTVVGNVLIGNDTKSVLSRYDQNGNCLWTRIGEFPIANTIACDKAGNSYIAGDGYTDSTSGNAGFLTKFDNAGNLIYSRTIPHTPNDIAIDNKNNIYVTGWFAYNHPININGNIYYANYSSNPQPQYFIKYDQSGNVLWYKIITGQIGRDAIATDEKGNAYLTISFSSLQIDDISLTFPNASVIVVKFDSIGNIAWYKNSTIVSTTSASIYPGAICVSSNNDVLITGAVHGIHAFDSFTTTQSTSYTDLLIAKIGQSSITTAISTSPAIVSDFNIYPNPANSIITISIFAKNPKQEYILRVLDTLDKVVYSENMKDVSSSFTQQFDLSQLPKGIYFVELQQQGTSYHSKAFPKEVKKIVLQ